MSISSLQEVYDLMANDSEFFSLKEEDKEIAIKSAAFHFAERNNILDDKGIDEVQSVAAKFNNKVRQSLRTGRYVPSLEQFGRIFSEQNIQFDEGGFLNQEEQLDQVEAARPRLKEAARKDPELFIHGEDTDFLFDQYLDQKRRVIKGEDTGYAHSLFSNAAQSFTSRIATTLGVSDKGIRDYFSENPAYDDNWFQKLSSGFGDVGGVTAMIVAAVYTGGAAAGAAGASAGGAALAGGVAGAGVSVWSNTLLRYKEAYDNEIANTGDKARANKAGMDNLPAAAVDSLADYLFAKALLPTRFKGLSGSAKKQAIVDYLAKPENFKSVGQGIIGGFAAQGASELAGDYASGQLQYNSTDNEGVIPSAHSLFFDSFLIGGVLGGAGSGIGAAFEPGRAKNLLAKIEKDGLTAANVAEAEQFATQQTQQNESGNTTSEKQQSKQGGNQVLGDTGKQNAGQVRGPVSKGAGQGKALVTEADQERKRNIQFAPSRLKVEAMLKNAAPKDALGQQPSKVFGSIPPLDNEKAVTDFLSIHNHIVDETSSRVGAVKEWYNKGGFDLVLRKAKSQLAAFEKDEVDKGPNINRSLIIDAWKETIKSLEADKKQALNKNRQEIQTDILDKIDYIALKSEKPEDLYEKISSAGVKDIETKLANLDIRNQVQVKNAKGKEITGKVYATNQEAQDQANLLNNTGSIQAEVFEVAPDSFFVSAVPIKAEQTESSVQPGLSLQQQIDQLTQSLSGIQESDLQQTFGTEPEDIEAQLANIDKFVQLGIDTESTGLTRQDLLNQVDALFNTAVKPKTGKRVTAMRDVINAAEIDADDTYADQVQDGFSTNLRSRHKEAGFIDIGAIASGISDIIKSGVTTISDFTSNLVSKFGEGISQFAQELYQLAKDKVGDLLTKFAENQGIIKYAVDPNQQTEFSVQQEPVNPGESYTINDDGSLTKSTEVKKQKKGKNVQTTESVKRKKEISKLINTYKRRIRGHKDVITQRVLASIATDKKLSAMEELEPFAADLYHDLVENFNSSRAGEELRVPYNDIFTKVGDLPEGLRDAAVFAGADLTESVSHFLLEKADQAYVARRVESVQSKVPRINESHIVQMPDGKQSGIKGLQKAYDDGDFDYDQGNPGSNKLQDYLRKNFFYEQSKEPRRNKRNADTEAKRQEYIPMALEVKQGLQDIALEDSQVYAIAGPSKETREVQERILQWMKDFDPEAEGLTSVQLERYITAGDEFIANGSLVDVFDVLHEMGANLMKDSYKGDMKDLWGKFRNSESKNKFLSRFAPIAEALSPTAINLNRLSAYKYVKEFLKGLYFYTNDAGRQFEFHLGKVQKELQEITKKHFGDIVPGLSDINTAIALRLSQYRIGHDPSAEFIKNYNNIVKSNKVALESSTPVHAEYHTRVKQQFELLTEGVDLENGDQFEQFAKNFETKLTAQEKEWVNDTIGVFSKWTNDLRFITEAVRGQAFEDVINYMHTAQISVNSGLEGVVQTFDMLMDGEFDDLQLGEDAYRKQNMLRQSSVAKNRTLGLQDGKILVMSGVLLANTAAAQTVFESVTTIGRKITHNLMNDPEIVALINSNEKGPPNPLRINSMKKWIAQEVQNMASRTSYTGELHRHMSKWAGAVGTLTLSKLHRPISEPLSLTFDYNFRHKGNFKAMKNLKDAMAVVYSPRLKDFFEEAGLPQRAIHGEALLKREEVDVRGFGKQVSKGMRLLSKGQEVVKIPIHLGDQIAARSAFLAEYINIEQEKGRAPKGLESILEGGVRLDRDSWHKATLRSNAMVNENRSSSRGNFYNSHEKWMSALRNSIFTFTSFGASMSAQAGTAIRDLAYFAKDRKLSKGEISENLGILGGIWGQSAGFTLGRAVPAALLVTIMMSAHRDANDDDRMKVLRLQLENMKNKRYKSDADKQRIADLEDEIQLLQGIRDYTAQIKRKLVSPEGLVKRFLRDSTGNIVMPMAMFGTLADNAWSIVIDPISEKYMNEWKKNEIAGMQAEAALAAKRRDVRTEVKLKQAVQDLEGLQYIKMGREQFGLPTIVPGVFGIGVDGFFDSMKNASLAVSDLTEFSLDDIILGFANFGIGQADVNDYLRFQDHLADKEFAANRKRTEAARLAEIKKQVREREQKPKLNIQFDFSR